jgi:sugar phosphate isomerase/epimerase
MPPFSLSYLTAPRLHPIEVLKIAAQTGYESIGLRILPAAPGGEYYPLIDKKHELPEILACIKDSGIFVRDLEMIRINADFNAKNFESFFEVGAQLGALNILVAGDDHDISRLTDSYAQLCEAAAPYHLTADIEFMPWTAIKSLKDALQVAKGAHFPKNAGIIIDSLHFARSDSEISDIDATPSYLLHYAQICDAPATIPTTDEELIRDARTCRLIPGEGGIALKDIFSHLPNDLPISIEVPHEVRQAQMSPIEWAKLCMEDTKKFYKGMNA